MTFCVIFEIGKRIFEINKGNLQILDKFFIIHCPLHFHTASLRTGCTFGCIFCRPNICLPVFLLVPLRRNRKLIIK